MTLTYTTSSVIINAHEWRIRHFVDRIQFPNESEKLLIGEKLWGQDVPSSLWPLVGIIWPAGLVLADLVSRMELGQLRVLELGCGLALSSMIAHKGGNSITASDYNPFAANLLRENALLNAISPVLFEQLSWQDHYDREVYDLIVGSDVLYEPDCVYTLIRFLKSALANNGKALFVDPGRDHVRSFEVQLKKNGFECDVVKLNPKQKMRILHVTRVK